MVPAAKKVSSKKSVSATAKSNLKLTGASTSKAPAAKKVSLKKKLNDYFKWVSLKWSIH